MAQMQNDIHAMVPSMYCIKRMHGLQDSPLFHNYLRGGIRKQ